MAQLTLHFLGAGKALLDGVPLKDLATDKTRALLAYLVIESKQAHRRESLAGLLWPDVSESSARQSLSQALSNLRKILNDSDSARPFLLADRETIQFNDKSDVVLDIHNLDNEGTFLEGLSIPDAEAFEEWMLLQRETFHRVRLEHLDRLIARSMDARQYAQAIALSHRQLRLDPWREEAYQTLITAYALSGQRSNALAHYEKCKQVLREALGVEPSATMRQLIVRIQNDELIDAKPVIPTVYALPNALTPLIGRTSELVILDQVLANPDARLITLVGIGGIGKTRLAIEAATQNGNRFENGVAFVALVSVDRPVGIAAAIAEVLGLDLHRSDHLKNELPNMLRGLNLLLILDGFEHLLNETNYADSIAFITDLLRTAPKLKLIVTSREPLDIHGEWVQDIGGLGMNARELFLQSAQRTHIEFVPNAEDERAIQRICNLVGDLPLGVELAASWTRLLSCADIATEIEKNIGFLNTNARRIPARHRSMAAVFESSWALLNAEERRVLTCLAIFRGGISREAAQATSGASLQILSTLVSKSLLQRTEARHFALHEVIRQFALQKLIDRDQAGDAHARYYLRFATTHGYEALPIEHRLHFAELNQELSNIDDACTHFIQRNDGESAARLIGSLLTLWLSEHGYVATGLEWVSRVRRWYAHNARSLPVLQELQLLSAQITLQVLTLDVTELTAELDAALNRFADALNNTELDRPSRHTYAYGLTALAWVQVRQGKMREAHVRFDEAISSFRSIGDAFGLAWALRGYSLALAGQQRSAESMAAIRECVDICRRLNDPRSLAIALGGYGECERAFGDPRKAIDHYIESASLLRASGDSPHLLLCLLNHLGAQILVQDLDAIRALAYDMANLMLRLSALPSGHLRAYAFIDFAGCALLLLNDFAQSVRLLNAGLTVFDRNGSSPQPAIRRTIDFIQAMLLEQRSAREFGALLAAGADAGVDADDGMLLQQMLVHWSEFGASDKASDSSPLN